MSERWDVFEKVLNRALDEIFTKVSWKKITEQFPQLMDQDVHKHSLKDLHTQVGAWFRSHVNTSLEKVFTEKQLYANLVLLQECVDNAQTRHDKLKEGNLDIDQLDSAERPLDIKDLSPRDVMACILHEDRKKEIERLEHQATQIDHESSQVEEQITATRADVEDLWSQITALKDRLDQEVEKPSA